MKQRNKIVRYDPRVDVMAIYIGNGSEEEEFVEIAPNVAVELDKKGAVIGVEILNASKVLRPVFHSMQQHQIAYA